jgi:hypothetical protein
MVSASHTLRRISTALARASRDLARLPLEVSAAEVLLWVRAGETVETGRVATRRPGGGVQRGAAYEAFLVEWRAPFAESKLVNDQWCAQGLVHTLETLIHTVHAIAVQHRRFDLMFSELDVQVLVASSGTLIVSHVVLEGGMEVAPHRLHIQLTPKTNFERDEL